MHAKRIARSLLVASAVSLGLLAWRQAAHARAAREESATLTSRIAATGITLQHARERLAAAEQDRRATQVEVDRVRLRPTAPARSPAPATPPRASGDILELIRNDPAAEVLYLEMQRARLASTYGPFFRSLGLSPEAVEKFQSHHLTHTTALMDLQNALRTAGDASAAAVAQLHAEAGKAYATAQRVLLGDEGYRALQDYERAAWFRGMVSAVAGAAAIEHLPLSPVQADALVRAAAEASSSYREGGRVDGSTTDWTEVETRARAILSPAQFELFRTMDPGPSRGGLLQIRFQGLVERAEAKAAASPPSPPKPGS